MDFKRILKNDHEMVYVVFADATQDEMIEGIRETFHVDKVRVDGNEYQFYLFGYFITIIHRVNG